MRIDSIKINGFGKLENEELNFKEGINIVYGENETGKSTILKCTQGLLYGVSKLKNGKDISDFDKYKPWDNSEFSGKIKYVLDNDEEYEVFRDFKKKSPVIYNKFQEDISKQFKTDKTRGINFLEEQIGVDESSFINTAIIGQQEVTLKKTDTNVIVQKISNLVSSGDDNISYKKSMEKLNKMQNDRVGTSKTKQKPMNIVDENIRQLSEKKKNLELYKQNQMQQSDEKEKLNNRLKDLLDKKVNLKIEPSKRKKVDIYTYLLTLFIVVFVIQLMCVRNIVINIVSIIPIIVMVNLIKRRSNKELKDFLEITRKNELEQENIQNEINQTNVRLHILDNEKNSIDEKLEELTKVEEDLEEQITIKNELMSLDISFNIAKEALERAYDEIKHNISPKFEQKLCEITSNITDGKYKNVKVNDETGLFVETENGEYLPVNRLSQGTIDEMYLSLRLSTLTEISNESLPIILDETFVYFDDNRLKNILCYLQDQNYDNQIIIFTCSNREKQILESLKIEYNEIILEN